MKEKRIQQYKLKFKKNKPPELEKSEGGMLVKAADVNELLRRNEDLEEIENENKKEISNLRGQLDIMTKHRNQLRSKLEKHGLKEEMKAEIKKELKDEAKSGDKNKA